MGSWKAIALRTINQETISASLGARGIDWNCCSHIPATTSLARVIRTKGTLAIPIAKIIDVVVLAGLGEGDGVPISSFPEYRLWGSGSEECRKNYSEAENGWSRSIQGKRIWFSMAHQQHLRDFLRGRGYPYRIRQVILRSSWEYSKTNQELIAAGVHPVTLDPADEVAKIARDAWIDLEEKFPSFTAVRDDLWIDINEIEQVSTDKASNLKDRLEAALRHLFGDVEGRRAIVWHGFHYFTPPQYAFFRLLKALPEVDQYFILHDDGRSAVFETWRRFFVERWGIPAPEIDSFHHGYTPPAKAFRDALHGESVDPDNLSGHLQIKQFKTSTEFVREWIVERSEATEQGDFQPRSFAASSEEICRFVDRFGTVITAGTTKLSMLPIGSFLYRIHDCISIGNDDEVAVQLSHDSIIEIATSGFLVTERHGIVGLEVSQLLRKALPYFSGCNSGDDWLSRSQDLKRLIDAEVAPLGSRSENQTDLERIRSAAGNLFRLAPWLDLTSEESDLLADIVHSLVRLVETIASRERHSLRDHLEFIQSRLLRAMDRLELAERQELEQTISGMRASPDLEVSADGLVDFIHLLLGNKADFSVTGEEDSVQRPFSELRQLDALGFSRLETDLHIANLSDVSFPTTGRTVGWPYHLSDLQASGVDIPTVSLEILQTRFETSGLSDLYLLFLGLNGVQEGQITLSYIEKMGNEIRNPSSILALLSEISGRYSDALRERTGGIPVTHASSPADELPVMARRNPVSTAIPVPEKRQAFQSIEPVAVASSAYCPRRFAIQWAIGPSAAFQSEHHHLMLYGNLLGALDKTGVMPEEEAKRVCDELWQQFTPGQLRSSEEKGVVRNQARAEWIYTLQGSRAGEDPGSIAYKAAINPHASGLNFESLSPDAESFLPAAHDHENDGICANCPVEPRCAAWMA